MNISTSIKQLRLPLLSLLPLLLFINILGASSYNFPTFNYNNGKGKNSNICALNYNNVYSYLYKWSKEHEESHSKIIEDTLWLNKNRFISPGVIIGVYNDSFNLNYICLLRRLAPANYKILNIFANPSNNFDDDLLLLKNLFEFAIYNDIKLNTDKLNEIDKSRYFLTYMYYYSQINSKTFEI
jgi:hypothetical protein